MTCANGAHGVVGPAPGCGVLGGGATTGEAGASTLHLGGQVRDALIQPGKLLGEGAVRRALPGGQGGALLRFGGIDQVFTLFGDFGSGAGATVENRLVGHNESYTETTELGGSSDSVRCHRQAGTPGPRLG